MCGIVIIVGVDKIVTEGWRVDRNLREDGKFHCWPFKPKFSLIVLGCKEESAFRGAGFCWVGALETEAGFGFWFQLPANVDPGKQCWWPRWLPSWHPHGTPGLNSWLQICPDSNQDMTEIGGEINQSVGVPCLSPKEYVFRKSAFYITNCNIRNPGVCYLL